MKSFLSGMPELKLGLNDKLMFEVRVRAAQWCSALSVSRSGRAAASRAPQRRAPQRRAHSRATRVAREIAGKVTPAEGSDLRADGTAAPMLWSAREGVGGVVDGSCMFATTHPRETACPLLSASPLAMRTREKAREERGLRSRAAGIAASFRRRADP